ncbi:VanZ family protein [Bacillus cereus]
MKSENRNKLTIALFVIYMLLLTGVILFKLPFFSSEISDGIRVINLIPFQGSFDDSGTIDFREIRGNILIFIPLGIYICILKKQMAFYEESSSNCCFDIGV